MKLWKIIITTICLVLLNSIAVFANEWSWDIGDYSYNLVKRLEYNEWNTTDVTVHSDINTSYVIFRAGTIEGELAMFDVTIEDQDNYTVYRYSSPTGMSHTMTFGQISELNLLPGEYKLTIVAKGYIDHSMDDYTLYVSYNPDDNNNEDIIIDDNGNIVSGENSTTSTDKTEQNNTTQNPNSVDSKDDPTSVTNTKPIKRVTIKSAKRLKNNKKKAKIKWKKIKGSKIRYEIICSTSKKFARKKTKTYTTKKYSITISKLAKKKKYYVKVRCYKIVDGEKSYGKYSKVKIIK